MNINSSLPILFNRSENSGVNTPARTIGQQETVAKAVASVNQQNSSQQQSFELPEEPRSKRDRIDLRVLADPSLSLTNQLALSAYQTTSNFDDSPTPLSRLDISV